MASNQFLKQRLCDCITPLKFEEAPRFKKLPEPVFCYLTKRTIATEHINIVTDRCLISWNRGDGHFVGDEEGENVTLSNLRFDHNGRIWMKRKTFQGIRDIIPGETKYNHWEKS